MKKAQKEELKKILTALIEYQEYIDTLADEEQDRFDQLSERSQESERGEALEEQISNLEYASDDLEDAIDMLKEVIGEE